jgi:hypothetical protein
MAMFKKKKPGYIDLGKKLSKGEERLQNIKSDSSPREKPSQEIENSQSSGFFGGFFAGNAQASEVQSSQTAEEKREKLKRKIVEMTNKLEAHEKEIYQLKQRIELLERKQRLNY